MVEVKPEIGAGNDSYDLEGNLLEICADNAQEKSQYFTLKYDAWNRLSEVWYGSTLVAEYQRDGIGRIVREEGTENGDYVYSVSWQLMW